MLCSLYSHLFYLIIYFLIHVGFELISHHTLLQFCAETALDMVVPGPSVRQRRYKLQAIAGTGQPADIRAGVSKAYNILYEVHTKSFRTFASKMNVHLLIYFCEQFTNCSVCSHAWVFVIVGFSRHGGKPGSRGIRGAHAERPDGRSWWRVTSAASHRSPSCHYRNRGNVEPAGRYAQPTAARQEEGGGGKVEN